MGWNMRYALLFPNDLTYTVGSSDWHKDWFFEEVPHATNLSFVNPDAKDPAKPAFWLGQSRIAHPVSADRPVRPLEDIWPRARYSLDHQIQPA